MTGQKRWGIIGVLVGLLLGLSCGLGGSGTVPSSVTPTFGAAEPVPIQPIKSGDLHGLLAREYLEVLTEELGPGISGSETEADIAEYIAGAFAEMGYEPEWQEFSFEDEEEETLESANVMAVKPGRSSREIIVGAHYDAVDDGEGADDNASGVAVMLEVAEALYGVSTPYTIRFVAFGAEEVDLNGSRYYVDQLSDEELDHIVVMINLDSLIAGDRVYVYGDAGELGAVRDWILERGEKRGIEIETQPGDNLDDDDGTPCECADYWPFEDAGVPFAYFEATNWELGENDGLTQVDPELGDEGEIRHTEYDTLDYLDDEFPGRVEHHLEVFVTLLYDTLTLYRVAE